MGISQQQLEQVSAVMSGKPIETRVDDESILEEEQRDLADPAPVSERELDSREGDEIETEESDSIDDLEGGADPVTLKDLARQLEIDAKDLYDVEIPIGGSESATLSELKDSYKAYKAIEAERTQWEDRKIQDENAILRSKRELEQLIGFAAKSNALTPELVSRLESMHNENLNREGRALLQAIPEWRDPALKTAGLDEIAEFLGEYSISRSEVLNSVDHRLIKFVWDQVKRRKLVADAGKRDKVPPTTRTTNGRRSRPLSALQKKIAQGKASNRREDKLSAINELMKG